MECLESQEQEDYLEKWYEQNNYKKIMLSNMGVVIHFCYSISLFVFPFQGVEGPPGPIGLPGLSGRTGKPVCFAMY